MRIDRRRVDIVQHAATLTLRRTLDSGWNVGGAAGVLAGGMLTVEGRRHVYGPGVVANASASRELLGDALRHMFLTTSWAVAVTVAPTMTEFRTRGLYGALDFSASLAVGRTIANVWSPYLSARAFGGPVWLTSVAGLVPGHDPEHHSLGCGSVLSLPKNLELGIDAALLGAKGVTASAGVNF